MSAMATRTVEVSSNQLDTAIEVLSSAARDLQLTRFEKFSYRLLMVSVDVVAVSLTILFILVYLEPKFHLMRWEELFKAMDESLRGIVLFFFRILFVASGVVSFVFPFVGIVALALNIPVFRKT